MIAADFLDELLDVAFAGLHDPRLGRGDYVRLPRLLVELGIVERRPAARDALAIVCRILQLGGETLRRIGWLVDHRGSAYAVTRRSRRATASMTARFRSMFRSSRTPVMTSAMTLACSSARRTCRSATPASRHSFASLARSSRASRYSV